MIENLLWIIAWYFIIGVVMFIVVWRAFILIMGHKDELRDIKTLPIKLYYLVPIGVVGWIGDVLWNIFYATPLFLMLPDVHKGMRIHDITLSHRLRQILRSDTSITEDMIRWKYADILCRKFIEPHDCTHCGRNDK